MRDQKASEDSRQVGPTRRRQLLKIALLIAFLVQGSGCTRVFFRNQADKEVAEILGDKDKYAAWSIDNFHVYPDPRARFADPTDQDFPPKPPDDPATYDLSPNPQKPGKAGVRRVEGDGYLQLIAKWDAENRLKQSERLAQEEQEDTLYSDAPQKEKGEGPIERASAMMQFAAGAPAVKGDNTVSGIRTDSAGRTSLDIQGRPTFLLTLDQAAELAMFNAREYQDARENLYMSALPVTLQRFSFTTQLFAATELIRDYSGASAPYTSNQAPSVSETVGTKHNNWTANSGTGLAKVLPTGGLLLLNFANQTVFDFLNPKQTFSATAVNFSAVQPLLRGGGFAVALESLTQAERNLLYEIRTFARFRKQLYVEIASNSGGSISGANFQPVGVLSNNTTATGGGGGSGLTPGANGTFSNVLSAAPVNPSSPGSLALTTAITPAPSGYLNSMLESIQIYIDKENIAVLSTILERYRGLLEGDVVGPLQLQNVEQQLLTGRFALLGDQQQYLDAVDSFKIEIGVPMQLNIEMDDSVLRPLINQFRRSRAIIESEQKDVMDATKLIPLENVPTLRSDLLKMFETARLSKGTRFRSKIRARLESWEKMSDKDMKDRLEEIRKESQAIMNRQADRQNQDLPPSAADAALLKETLSRSDLGNYERVLRKYEADFAAGAKAKKLDPAAERRRIVQFRDVVSYWQKILVEARDERWALVREKWPDLPRCCIDGVDLVKVDISKAEAAAARYALSNRLDLMNSRAQVVDAWRQLAVFANALLGVFTVQYQFNAASPPGIAEPVNVGGSTSNHQLILNTQLPLVRIQERNNYRTSLIAFQRQRRALQEAEDLTSKAVRAEIHALRVYAEAYKIQQRQLELAYLTIDSALEALQAPTPPGAARGGDGPAALTQQLLNAQRTLPTAQNALLTIWINYLDARLQLYRDLELMPLDARGVWIDEIRECDCSLNSEQLPQPNLPLPGAGERLPEPRKLPTAP
jgi:hypothetical protein